jgi:hypothetical protein
MRLASAPLNLIPSMMMRHTNQGSLPQMIVDGRHSTAADEWDLAMEGRTRP